MLGEEAASQWEGISLIAEKQKYSQKYRVTGSPEYLGKGWNKEQESERIIGEKGRDSLSQFIY